ncbi:MAG: tRNA (N(6)-L-threonylcarbamoyladenosine(37)-C(2))-methylthiotransferase MtaB [Lachnospiraceae bacterium]|jgi:threonylcarbamoyladenosine tRNA methylthiotransferase MtaB|nr:tRNA (N(6)-L-threonylcarbamoyladenosine(37)-C(2))-methylthiotransferase MtaB [Lachnospiraceae bacterium]MCI1727244.1 tRNA (N(6)-L-threonylcarbamoyladenosine(37)-C(2))-methylthiotransferase MtaB [Lachnospiraceae bacterium]
MKRAALHNLGCKVNEYETAAMEQMLVSAGYEIVPFTEAADLYVVNTCTVTNTADRKSRQMLHKAKQANPSAVVVAAGCYVNEVKEKLLEDPAVDIIIGNNEKKNLLKILKEYEEDPARGKEAVPEISSEDSYERLSVTRTYDRTRAFVKIQDGCNQFCSYCAIPYVRGRVRSRRAEDILEEVSALAENGVKEIVLSGIHISSYGLDFDEPGRNVRTPEASEEKTNLHLLELIRALQKMKDVHRIRLGSLEPGIVTREFVQQAAAFPLLCPQFHLSLQSGCDATLKRMNRRYTTEEYEKAVVLLRRYFTLPAITTDIIAGFPGETEEEFAETLRFAEKIHFAKTHVFKYSRRRGTAADVLPDQVTEAVKTARSKALMSLDRQNRFAYARALSEFPAEVLFEDRMEMAGISYWTGHTEENVTAVMASEKDLSNTIVRCRILSVTEEGYVLCEADAEEKR